MSLPRVQFSMRAARCTLNNIRNMASFSEGKPLVQRKTHVEFSMIVEKDLIPLVDCFVNEYTTQEPLFSMLNLSHSDKCNMATFTANNAILSGHSLKLVDPERNNKIVGFRCISKYSVHPEENARYRSPLQLDLAKASKELRQLILIVEHSREIFMEYAKKAKFERWLLNDDMYIDPEYNGNGQNLSKNLFKKEFSTEDLFKQQGIDGFGGECTSARSLKMSLSYGSQQLESLPESVYKKLGLPVTEFRLTPIVYDMKNIYGKKTGKE